MAVARRPIDRDAVVHQALADGIDVVDRVGEVAEVAALAVVLGIPVVGQLHLCLFIAGRREEYQRESALLVFVATQLVEPERAAIEPQRLVDV